MRVTFLYPVAELTGGIRVAGHLAQELHRRGHEVLQISLPRPKARWRSRIGDILRGDLESAFSFGHRRSHLYALEAPWRVIDRHRPIVDADVPDGDAVIATWWETGEWASRLSPSKGVFFHLMQQWESNFGVPESDIRRVWAMPSRKLVTARWLQEIAEKQFSQEADLVPQGVDTRLFDAPPRGKQAVPTIGIQYSPLHAKGPDILAATFDALERSLATPFRVLAYGNAPLNRSLPIARRLEFTLKPSSQRLREIYGSCDVWLVASRSEGFHLPPHEAMACRCPVVGSRVGGCVELIEPGVTGHLADVEDVAGLVSGLRAVLGQSDGDWRQMSGRAHDAAQVRTWSEAGEALENFLQAEITRKRR